MRRVHQEPGERDWAYEDLRELQSEPLRAVDGVFGAFGDCVISGCEVVGDAIGGGMVSIGGRVMPFEGATGVVFPCRLVASAEEIIGKYVDNGDKPIAYDYKAIVAVDGDGIEVTASGAVSVLRRGSDAIDSDSSATFATSKAVQRVNERVTNLSEKELSKSDAIDLEDSNMLATSMAVATVNKRVFDLAGKELPKSDRIDLEDSDTLATSTAVATVNKKMIAPNDNDTFGRKGDAWVAIERWVYVNGKTIEEHTLGEDIDRGDLVFANNVYNFNSATFISNGIDSLPTGAVSSFSFTADSKYLAVAVYSPPQIIVYKNERNILKKLPALISVNGSLTDCSFTADGLYLTVVNNNEIIVFKRDGDQFTKLINFADAGFRHLYCSFSPDGLYLAVGRDKAPHVSIYKRNNDEFTKLLDLDSSPSPAGEVKFSQDGVFLLVTGQNVIIIYKRSEDIFNKVHASEMSSAMRGSATFSPDAMYVGCSLFYPPYVAVLKRNGDEFIKLPDIAGGVGSGNDCAFSPDGLYLAVAHRDSPNLIMFKRSGDTFSKVYGVPGTTYECTNVKFSPDGRFYVASQVSSSYMLSYSASAYDHSAIFKSIVKESRSTLKGVAIENGVKGEKKKILITEKF